MYTFKTPFFLPWIYPEMIWRKPRENKIYLTFDDGPIPEVTPFVLSTLAQYQAKATFFCIGDNVQKHPEIYQSVLAAGHSVGNHTFNHLKGWDTPDDEYISNFNKCSGVVRSNLFRPPYGRIRRSQVRRLRAENSNLQIVMWDVLSGDFDVNLHPEKCLRKVVKRTCKGSIVVFHDSLKAFDRLEYVLPRALKFWHDKGFSMEKL